MVAEAELVCRPNVAAVPYLCVPTDPDFLDISSAETAVHLSRRDSAWSCSTSIQIPTSFHTPTKQTATPILGLEVSTRTSMFVSMICWSHQPSSFYAVLDAALYLKNNFTRFFIEESTKRNSCKIWRIPTVDHFWPRIKPVDSYCGTTALTALVLGRNLLVANVGDCRAVVLCRKGDAVQLSQDHRPSCQVERKRVLSMMGTSMENLMSLELSVIGT